MNTIFLAEQLEVDCHHYDLLAAEKLRDQRKAIILLREALDGLITDKSIEYIPTRLWNQARRAMEETEILG